MHEDDPATDTWSERQGARESMTARFELAPAPELTAKERLLCALDLMAVGVAAKREALQREHPHESAKQIDERLFRWRARLD